MLAIQYCARHYYNFAEYLNYTSWAICIVTTIILSLPTVSSFLGEKNNSCSNFFNILALVVDYLYKRFIKKQELHSKCYLIINCSDLLTKIDTTAYLCQKSNAQ